MMRMAQLNLLPDPQSVSSHTRIAKFFPDRRLLSREEEAPLEVLRR